jgi:hypothetical protein
MIDWRRWLRRKPEKRPPAYEDPLAIYGRMVGGQTPPPAEAPRSRTLWNRIFHAGHDAGFVYYDE